MLLSQVYCVWKVVKTPTITSNNPVYYVEYYYIMLRLVKEKATCTLDDRRLQLIFHQSPLSNKALILPSAAILFRNMTGKVHVCNIRFAFLQMVFICFGYTKP